MKSILVSLAIITAELNAFPAQAAPGDSPQVAISTAAGTGPRIRFSETAFDFQKVQPTEQPRHEFIFTNIGQSLLEITDVRPGCGCTTVGAWDRQVQPGKTGKIPLTFNPGSYRGPVVKGVTITCNDPAQRSINLQFQATVWRPIEVQPQSVYFAQVEDEPAMDAKVVRIVSNLEEPLALEAPRSSNPAFRTELKTVKPEKEFELRVTCTGVGSNGTQRGTITLQTSSTNLPMLSLNAVVILQPALVALPQQIRLPAGRLGLDYRYAVTIRNNSRAPVVLSEPAANIEGVTAQVHELELGKTFKLELCFPPEFQLRPEQALEVSVKTSHPKYPVFKVPILR